MKDWKTIQKEIIEALSEFTIQVQYCPPIGKGNDAQCSMFVIVVSKEDFPFLDAIQNTIQPVCKKWKLSPYTDSLNINLCAHWDINKDS